MSRPRRRLAITVLPAVLLAACASQREPAPPPGPPAAPPPVAVAPPPPAPAPAVRKVPGGCVPRSLPAAPAYPDTDARLRAAGEAAERYQLMAAGRLLRMRRLAELERVVAACRRAGT